MNGRWIQWTMWMERRARRLDFLSCLVLLTREGGLGTSRGRQGWSASRQGLVKAAVKPENKGCQAWSTLVKAKSFFRFLGITKAHGRRSRRNRAPTRQFSLWQRQARA